MALTEQVPKLWTIPNFIIHAIVQQTSYLGLKFFLKSSDLASHRLRSTEQTERPANGIFQVIYMLKDEVCQLTQQFGKRYFTIFTNLIQILLFFPIFRCRWGQTPISIHLTNLFVLLTRSVWRSCTPSQIDRGTTTKSSKNESLQPPTNTADRPSLLPPIRRSHRPLHHIVDGLAAICRASLLPCPLSFDRECISWSKTLIKNFDQKFDQWSVMNWRK